MSCTKIEQKTAREMNAPLECTNPAERDLENTSSLQKKHPLQKKGENTAQNSLGAGTKKAKTQKKNCKKCSVYVLPLPASGILRNFWNESGRGMPTATLTDCNTPVV